MKTTSQALSALLLLTALSVQAQETALDRYVAKPDPHYSYTVTDADDHVGRTNFFISMTSQQWRSLDEVDRVLWQHDMVVVVPQNPFSDAEHTAVLFIDGGSNGGGGPSEDLVKIMELLSIATNSVTAVLRQVPNQPLYFSDEIDNPRKEDAILAYSFDKYLATGDEEWPVHLAMTKAVIRAMDTIQDVADDEGERVDNFVVIGGSKRGWTAWLVAAADPKRVKGVIPISIDLLNMEPQFIHHWEAYGFYAPALNDYVEFDLPCQVGTPGGRALRRIVDPYEYRDRYTMPKYIINSAGDQFFVPDSWQFYYHDLPGPKQLRYTLNTDHGQADDVEDLVTNIAFWVDDVINDKTSPAFSWGREPDGSIRVQTGSRPDKVYLWQARNPDSRDFRREVIGPVWTRSELQDSGGGVYVGRVPTPAQGFTAFTVELVFKEDVALGLLEADLKFTTGVNIVPDILPFEGTACPGSPQMAVLGETSINHTWRSVPLAAKFEKPVVIVGPPTYHAKHPGVVRLRNVGANGFDMRFQEWLYLDGIHMLENVPYLVLEQGRQVMSDGTIWEAGTFSLNGTGNWKPQSFSSSFPGKPALFLTAQTYNGGQPMTVRARSVTADSFEAAIFEEEALMDGHKFETIGYLAVYSREGWGTMDLGSTTAPFLLQSPIIDHRFSPVLSYSIKLEEEQSKDDETVHTDELLSVMALGDKLFSQIVSVGGRNTIALRQSVPEYAAAMEWGVVDGVNHKWKRVPLAKTYSDPVVIAKPVSDRNARPGVIRLKNSTGRSFQLRYQEWPYLANAHPPEKVFYLVADVGRQNVAGLAVEAGKVNTNALRRQGRWEMVDFNAPFTNPPATFASVETFNGGDAVITRIGEVDGSGLNLAMDEQEINDDGHAVETLGWIAVEQGSGMTEDGRKLLAFGDAVLNHNRTSVPFGQTFARRYPVVVGDVASSIGLDPVVLRYGNVTDNQIELFLQEEQSADPEVLHARENISVFVAE